MEFFIQIRDFIVKDVENANETKRASVIMRSFSLILCIFSLIQSICMAVFREWGGAAVSVVALVCYAVMFYYTYRNRTRTALLCIILSTLFWVILFVILFGGNCGIQHFLLALLVLLLLVSHADTRHKVLMALGMCAVSLCLYWYTQMSPPVREPGRAALIVRQTLSTVGVFFAISAIILLFGQDSLLREKKLVAYNEKLRETSSRDPLTKLYNRRAMLEYLGRQAEKVERYGSWFDVAIGDIDFFKKVNDTYGHEAGDAVLVRVAGLLSEYMSDKGEVCRWGGEEFLLVFTDINGEEALVRLEELRTMIGQQEIAYKEKKIRITMTFGLDEYDNKKPIDDTIRSADQKLYIGKKSGRNRVVF